MKSFFDHPLWLVGFRPFFTLAFISGMALPLIWAVFYLSGGPSFLQTLNPIQWHAHEMLYGFGWAVLGGFLLTASKNWVKIRGLHGAGLAFVVALWIVERVLMLNVVPLGEGARLIFLNLSITAIGVYVSSTLVQFRKQDSFPDNFVFVLALPLFLFAKVSLLRPETYSTGTELSIGLFRVAFAVMFERTMTQFMKNAMKAELLRNRLLDSAIKGSIFLAAFQSFYPRPVAIFLLLSSMVLLLFRFCFWKPLLGFRRFEIGVMYSGYLGLCLHLGLEALRLLGHLPALGTLSVHAFTFLCMGLVIPPMLIRICQGHTGRPLVFTTSDRFAIWSMAFASFFRLVATQVWPDFYRTWIGLAGLGWALCFAVIGWRLTPYLWQARVDGKVH